MLGVTLAARDAGDSVIEAFVVFRGSAGENFLAAVRELYRCRESFFHFSVSVRLRRGCPRLGCVSVPVGVVHLLALAGHAVVEKEEVRAIFGLRVEPLRLPCDDRQHRADRHRYGRASEVRPAGFLSERDFLHFLVLLAFVAVAIHCAYIGVE